MKLDRHRPQDCAQASVICQKVDPLGCDFRVQQFAAFTQKFRDFCPCQAVLVQVGAAGGEHLGVVEEIGEPIGMFRWLDDGTKDTNLVPANFVPSILAALPTDLKVQALGDILTPLGVSVRLIGGDAGQRPEVLCMLRTLIKENGEAQQAVANLVDGADDQELQEAHRELSESRAATDEALRMIDQMRRPRLVQG